MSRTTHWLSFLSVVVLLAATVGCGSNSPASSRDGAAAGTGGNAAGSGGSVGGSGGSGGAPADAEGTGGSPGSGGALIDAAGTGGSPGSGGAPIDAAGTGGSGDARDAGSDVVASADAAGACPGSANAKACVACCDALHPGGLQDAFFGNECLYCTAACGSTKLCSGVTGNPTNDIDGPCLACAQPRLSNNCRSMSAPRCPAFIECLKRCPTN